MGNASKALASQGCGIPWVCDILLKVVLYGALKWFIAPEMPFLNRMAVCFGVVMAALALVTLIKNPADLMIHPALEALVASYQPQSSRDYEMAFMSSNPRKMMPLYRFYRQNIMSALSPMSGTGAAAATVFARVRSNPMPVRSGRRPEHSGSGCSCLPSIAAEP